MARMRALMARRGGAYVGDPGFGSWLKRAFKPPKIVRKIVGTLAPIVAPFIPGVGGVVARLVTGGGGGGSAPPTAEGVYGPGAAILPPPGYDPRIIPGPGMDPVITGGRTPRDAGMSVMPEGSGPPSMVAEQQQFLNLLRMLQGRRTRRGRKRRR